MPKITEFNGREALFSSAASWIADRLKARLSHNFNATLLLSGGSTPAPAYEALSEVNLDWPNVLVGLVDERWVPPEDDASNEKLIRDTLLQNHAESAHFMPMKTPDETSKQAAFAVNELYNVFRKPDVVVLGMGPDGHTASWFPGCGHLDAAFSSPSDKVVMSYNAKGAPVAGTHTDRMTITAACAARAKSILLLLTGDEKRAVLEDEAKALPIHRFLSMAKNETEIMWAP